MLTNKTFPWLPLWRHTKETTTSLLRMTSLFSNLPKDENLVSIQMHLLLKLTLMNTFNIELFTFKNTFSGRCRYNLDRILRKFLRGHFNFILHKLTSTKGTGLTGRSKPRRWHDAGVQACAGGVLGLELSALANTLLSSFCWRMDPNESWSKTWAIANCLNNQLPVLRVFQHLEHTAWWLNQEPSDWEQEWGRRSKKYDFDQQRKALVRPSKDQKREMSFPWKSGAWSKV